MKKAKRFKFNLFYTAIALFAAQNTFAAANFNITPYGTLPTTVTMGQSVSATFTVTNMTHTARNGYVLQGLPTSVTQNTTAPNCANPINLGPRASCQLQLDITGAVSSNFAICKANSCTTATTPLNVSVNTTPPIPTAKFLYVASYTYTGPYVSVCTLDPTTKEIATCNDAGQSSVFNGVPLANIVLNSHSTIAYILNGYGSPSVPYVYQCEINPTDGTFSSCSQTSITSPNGFDAYYGSITLNPTNTIAFITDYNNGAGRILACPITNNVISGTCTDTGATSVSYYGPGLALNKAGTTAYIGNDATPVGLTVCSVTGSTFSSCSNISGGTLVGGSSFTFSGVAGVALTNSENTLYIVENANSIIYGCPPPSVGNPTLTNCFIATSTINNAWGVALNAANTSAYVTDFNNSTYSCAINSSDGTFSCAAPYTGISAPDGVALSY
jgi:hypothetical protein